MTYRPTPALTAHSPNLIHTSTRTTLSTNADPTGASAPRITLRVTKMDLRWVDGEVLAHFTANEVDVTPPARRRTGRAGR